MSTMKLFNKTDHVAQFVVKKGTQTIARIPGVVAGGSMEIPTTDTYQVRASIVLDNNTYISAPHKAVPGKHFLAQVLQISSEGTYDFNIVETDGDAPDALVFEKTTIAPVTYTILKNGKPLQKVTVADNYDKKVLHVGSTYYIYSVINGVTTATISTNDPDANVSALNNTSTLEADFFHLELS